MASVRPQRARHARDEGGEFVTTGLHVEDDLETYLAAARSSRVQNLTVFDEPVRVMQVDEFVSTWASTRRSIEPGWSWPSRSRTGSNGIQYWSAIPTME
ncbi:hypothetical protein [Singulisphaera sp. GP187]|uniref:hypothetical protein n=1 Tax=Singulisphaera sp. GP187 TaxID=1882752 RepID=UPI001160E4AB|nr:hypothetical protein [Singulisphaera sp. GP187]